MMASVPSAVLSDSVPLMERSDTFVNVQVHHFAGRICLRVEDANGVRTALIPDDRVLDAFAHPYVYLDR